jgi:pyrroloquinoline-quinone synthase
MNNNLTSWTDQLDQIIQQKHMLMNPFYRAWTEGQLTKEQLKNYAQEYYHHVKAFPTYLSALHSRCDDMNMRKALLQNLMDEEAGTPNHPDLWRSFMLALGVSQAEIDSHHPKQETQDLIRLFKESCSSQPLAFGVASLYSYESQIPSICQTKIEGLKQWYGIKDPEDYRYFSVHEVADVEHSETEKDLLKALVSTNHEKETLQHADKVLDSLNTFLISFL